MWRGAPACPSERGVMKGDDAVEDFCAVAGIDAAGLERPARVNEGLTRRAAGVLRRLNALAAAVAKPGSACGAPMRCC